VRKGLPRMPGSCLDQIWPGVRHWRFRVRAVGCRGDFLQRELSAEPQPTEPAKGGTSPCSTSLTERLVQTGNDNHLGAFIQFLDRHERRPSERRRPRVGRSNARQLDRTALCCACGLVPGKSLLEIKTSTSLAALGLPPSNGFRVKGRHVQTLYVDRSILEPGRSSF
jgi:hypothetical protein